MDKRIITYSFLAHVNNQTSSQSHFSSLFIPLVKRCLSVMCANGKYKGDDIGEIETAMEHMYGLNMPQSMLKILLVAIAKELNNSEKTKIIIYRDNSFVIEKYAFDEYEEEIKRREMELLQLEEVFSEFKKTSDSKIESESIFGFIEENKISIGKYIGQKYPTENGDGTIAARFVSFIQKIPQIYNVAQSVYIGSIISTYLEYNPVIKTKGIELVLDTNFIISLLDLNTYTSTVNCRRLLDIAGRMGYHFTILDITLEEIDMLLRTRIENFDVAFLPKQLDPEDIYNACERRKLSKTDLDSIRANVVSAVEAFGIIVISNTEKYRNRAKQTQEFEKLKEVRNTTFAALHDATCIEYVKEKRGKTIYHYDKVNCWLVNNSSSRSNYQFYGQPFQIKAEDLLNLLWLSSPMVKGIIGGEEMSAIGLSRLVSATLDNSLPNSMTVKLLDDNIQKYAKGNISDEDIVRISKSISERTITNLEGLNQVAQDDKAEFVAQLQVIVAKQKEKEGELASFFQKMSNNIKEKANALEAKIQNIDNERKQFSEGIYRKHEELLKSETEKSLLANQVNQLRQEHTELLNEIRKPKREKYIRKQVWRWRFRSIVHLIILFTIMSFCFVLVLKQNSWHMKNTVNYIKDNPGWSIASGLVTLFISGFFIKRLSDKYNQSAINAFRANIEIPTELSDIK